MKALKDKVVNVMYYESIGTGAETNVVTLKKVVFTGEVLAVTGRVTFVVFNNSIYINTAHVIRIELAE